MGNAEYLRSHAIYLTRLAEAHLELHDLEAAVVHGIHAARCLSSVDSARSAHTLAGLPSKLEPHRGNPAVREFLAAG